MSNTFATRCPNCQTGFRVTTAQLIIADGSVRCGICMHVFQALQNLITDPPVLKAMTPPAPAAPAAPNPESTFDGGSAINFETQSSTLKQTDKQKEGSNSVVTKSMLVESDANGSGLDTNLKSDQYATNEFFAPKEMSDTGNIFKNETENSSAYNSSVVLPSTSHTGPQPDDYSYFSSKMDTKDNFQSALESDNNPIDGLTHLSSNTEVIVSSSTNDISRPTTSPAIQHAPAAGVDSNNISSNINTHSTQWFDEFLDDVLKENDAYEAPASMANNISHAPIKTVSPPENPNSLLSAENTPQKNDQPLSYRDASPVHPISFESSASTSPATKNLGSISPQSTQQPKITQTTNDDKKMSKSVLAALAAGKMETPSVAELLKQPFPSATQTLRSKSRHTFKSQPNESQDHFTPIHKLDPSHFNDPDSVDDDVYVSTEELLALTAEPLQLGWDKTEKRPKNQVLWLVLMTMAMLTLLSQYLWQNRELILTNTKSRAGLESICQLTGCVLPPKIKLDQITSKHLIVRSHPKQLQGLVVDAILLNTANFPQPFPNIELIFSDIQGQIVASRQFLPAEYLSGELAGKTLMPSKTPVHIAIDIVDPGSHAINYRLKFF